MLHKQTTLNCNGKLVDIASPIIMGILNVTPDSFFDGGKYQDDSSILNKTEQMVAEGATIIDVGGMSSRPGAKVIDTETELKRVIPSIQQIKKRFPEIIISIDTVRSQVAKEAIEHGASIVNDISAGSLDDALLETVASYNVPYILMHMQGRPEMMQTEPRYQDVVVDVLDFLIEKLGELRALKIKDVIIDPGFGFGKEIQHNFRLLKRMRAFQILECPILAGISRKSFIYKTLNISAKDALTGTIALHMTALDQGAKILRVHDVKEASETIKIWKALNEIKD